MNDTAIPAAILGQGGVYPGPMPLGLFEDETIPQESPIPWEESPIHCETDLGQGLGQAASAGPASLPGGMPVWGKVFRQGGTARVVSAAGVPRASFTNGAAVRNAAVGFFASSGDGAAAAALRASVRFDTSYRAGDLAGTLAALDGARRTQLEQLQKAGCAAADRLAQLDRLQEKAAAIAAGSFSDLVGGFFRQYGSSGERDKVYNSVLAASGAPEAGPYTLEELDFAAVSVSQCRRLLEDVMQGDGVRQLLYMNRLELEVRSVAARGQIGGELAELLCTAERAAFREAFAALERSASQGETVDLRG